MNQQLLGASDLSVGRLSYGCMRITGAWNPADITPEKRAAGKQAVLAAYEAGYTLFDHADIYAQGASESLFGEVLREVAGMRERVVVATKCGIRWAGDSAPDAPHRYDFSAEHIRWSCDQSLQRLGIEQIDVYQLHRPDALMQPEEVAKAFDELYRAGKVKWFGVSNFRPSQVSALRAHCPFTLVVNQVEISLGKLFTLDDGTLDQCLELGITPLAWSPMAGGWLGDGTTVSPDDAHAEHKANVLKVLDEVAQKYGVSRTAMSLAWLLKHPAGIIPIVGTCLPDRIRDSATADSVPLSREDWYRLYVAGRGVGLP